MGHIGRYNKLEPTLVLRATVPIAVSLGIVFFPLCWVAYGDIVGGYTYPGLIAQILGTFRRLFWETNEVTRRCSLALRFSVSFMPPLHTHTLHGRNPF